MLIQNRIRTLVVDDDPLARALTMTVLGEHDEFELVGAAADGEEAVELARRLRPAAIVMDLYMPVLNGIEATRRITDERPETVVILHTSSDQPGDLERALAAGVTAYVPKQAVSDVLVRTLLEATSKN